MSETIYRVADKHSVNRANVMYLSGDIVPKSAFTDQPGRIEELLQLGFLTTKLPALAVRDGAKETTIVVGIWRVNPKHTAGKSLVSLNLMILEIDPSVGPMDTIEEARELLSIDYHPE